MLGASQKPFSDSFGNYLLHGMEEIFLADPVSWWPQTVAWKVLGVLFVLWVIRWLYRRWHKWKHNAYRREAIREIRRLQNDRDHEDLASKLPKILKATALHAYPRSRVAKLTGREWLLTLDQYCARTQFDSELGEKLLKLSYRENSIKELSSSDFRELAEMVVEWIQYHTITDTDAAAENAK